MVAAIVQSRARQRWSTADVDSRHALAYWVDTICKSFLEIDIDSPQRHQFRARLEQSELGPATFNLIEADTQTVRRTPARIAHSRYAGYFLLQLRAGQLRFQQYGRDSRIEAGDCVLVDCSAPYRLECLQATRASGGEKLLNRIRRTIRDRCHEAELTPGAVADAHGISKRYLHHLFATADSTFGDELMRMRLDCAHRLLSDSRFAALSVGEVAARCGFLDPSHFARRFRRAYGAAPIEFRVKGTSGKSQRSRRETARDI